VALFIKRGESLFQGTQCIKKLNFVDLPNCEIEHRENLLGISLGDSSDQILSSINSIKNFEKKQKFNLP
jgi:hypothetical protein